MTERIRILASGLAALALFPRAAPERIAFQPTEGIELEKSFEEELSLELAKLEVTVNGEDARTPDGVEAKLEDREHLVFEDHYAEMQDGRPRKLERKFAKLENSAIESASSEAGDSENERQRTSVLDGRAVVFTWDEEEHAYTRAYEGEGGDVDLLDALEEDTDFRRYLPEKEVAEDESWDVDPKAFLYSIEPGGDLAFESDDEDDDASDDEIGAQLRENMDGTIRATFRGKREVEGDELLVIAIRAEVRSHAKGEPAEHEDASTESTIEYSFEVEGELLWDGEAQHARSLELAGPAKLRFLDRTTAKDEEEEFVLVQDSHFEGRVTFRASFRAPK